MAIDCDVRRLQTDDYVEFRGDNAGEHEAPHLPNLDAHAGDAHRENADEDDLALGDDALIFRRHLMASATLQAPNLPYL